MTHTIRSNPRLMLAIAISALCMMTGPLKCEAADDSKGNIAAKPVGTATRAWLSEQRGDVNRAEPEPYPAQRAAAAAQRYESSVASGSEGSGAARPGVGIGLRSGSTGGSTGSTGSTSAPGMGASR